MAQQPDLFKADIVVFPFDRRDRDVIQAAKFLNLVHGPFADKGWKDRIKRMVAPLRAAGVPEDEIRRQVLAYQDAVQAALQAMPLHEEARA